jgi:acyl CoA:acetate/3-ketoacid CoA transferase beta subunit
MEMMADFRHPHIRRFIAWIDGQAAGGGSSWMLDGVLGVAGTSTLPQFRRRGVQAAITSQAILDGREADLIIATTAPGSTSQRTFERLGFQLLYTRTILVKA